MILVTDSRWISLLLLSSTRTKSLDIDPLLLAADKPVRIYFLPRFSGMKKAALEILSQICEISFFSLKTIKWAGRWGRLYENITEIIHYEKISYAAIPKNKKNKGRKK